MKSKVLKHSFFFFFAENRPIYQNYLIVHTTMQMFFLKLPLCPSIYIYSCGY